MEKLNVNRCMAMRPMGEPVIGYEALDDARAHLWSSEPAIEITELGPVAWWVCGRCPGRVLHDPETEDGFPEEPIVVYSPSCFDEVHREPHGDGSWTCTIEARTCPCPRRASGDVVHLEGCNAVFTLDAIQRHEHGCGAPHVDGRCMAGDTDPAPPSEELARAIEEAEDEDPPTLKRITPVSVESAASIFERVEALFGRPLSLGDDAGADLAFDALGGIEG